MQAAPPVGKAPVMAKLYFHYSTMNAGKSTLLLQAAHNYRERGMATLLLTAALDTRAGSGRIASRIGIAADAMGFDPQADLFDLIARAGEDCACVFVDEAQFLTRDQVWQLARVADDLGVPVMAYGLRVDFRGELFAGSAALLALADESARGAHDLPLRAQGHDGGAPGRRWPRHPARGHRSRSAETKPMSHCAGVTGAKRCAFDCRNAPRGGTSLPALKRQPGRSFRPP